MRKIWISLVILVMTTLVLSACGSTAPAATNPTSAPAAQSTQAGSKAAVPTQAAGMSHDPDPMSDNSYDVHFIDSTIEHHAAVLIMAQQVLKESTTVALKDLAQNTMTATQKEIDYLKAYRQKVHPKAAQMKDNMNMGAMGIAMDANKSFDKRYAEAMITHHQGSITMAKEALTKAGHDDLKQFAKTMQAAEEAEIVQLQKFLK